MNDGEGDKRTTSVVRTVADKATIAAIRRSSVDKDGRREMNKKEGGWGKGRDTGSQRDKRAEQNSTIDLPSIRHRKTIRPELL